MDLYAVEINDAIKSLDIYFLHKYPSKSIIHNVTIFYTYNKLLNTRKHINHQIKRFLI